MKYSKKHKIESIVLEFNSDEAEALATLCEIADNWLTTYGIAAYPQSKVDDAHQLVKMINHALVSNINSDITYKI